MPPLSSVTASLRTRWAKIEGALGRRPLLWSVVLAATLAALFALTLSPGYETNDDVAMQSIVDGTSYGEPLPHLVFSNVLIGLVLSSLYRAAEGVPWYGIYLGLAHLCALLVAVYATLSGRVGRLWVRLLGLAAVLTAFHLSMWMQLQFTSTAILFGASGVVLYWAVAQRTPARWGGLALAGAMVGASSWIRWRSATVALLLALPVVILSLRRVPWRRQAVFAATAAVMLLVGSVAQSLYYRDRADWQTYFAFNATRGSLQQSPYLGNVRPAVLTQVGWTVNDLWMFQRWFFADHQVHEAADLEVIADSLPTSFRWRAAAETVTNDARGWLGGFRLATIAGLALLFWREGNRHTRQVLVAGLATAGVIAFALAGTVKLPNRVAVPMLAFTALLGLTRPQPEQGPGSPDTDRMGPAWRGVAAAVFLTATVVGAMNGLSLDRQQHQLEAHLRQVLSALERTDPDGLFVSWGGELPLNGQSVSPWQRGGLGRIRLLSLGWQQRSPMHREMLATEGIDDVCAALATRPDVYLPLVDPTLGETYLQYLREHYGFSALLRPAGRAGPYTIYDQAVRYRINHHAGTLIERHLDGTRVVYRLTESSEATPATLAYGDDGSLIVSGRASADLVVVTDLSRAIALALPNDPTDEDDPGGFQVILDQTPSVCRVFALSGRLAIDLTP